MLNNRSIPCAASMLLTLTHGLVGQKPESVPLRAGMVITRSVRIMPGVYRLPGAASLDSPVITIRGDDITVDFAGATLLGNDPAADPDQARGVAIQVDGGRNVRIQGASVHGFHIGLRAQGTRGLTLANNDFSYNWKPRLFSGVEHESLVDWLSHHHNDKEEWQRFGAGVYLSDVHGGEIRANRIEQGMEGLMLTGTDSVRIWNNTIEYNSGVGIGLYRSSYNTIMHNHASYNVRGYSHGFFRRGQDSADLLLYEQSSHNIVAFNSMTHGGDGLFLWAGQSTMDTGQGGANDNLFYANDFSFAPTNAMEATFSRNTFIANRAQGSEYGLWGGYSFDSRVIGNDFARNRTGVAIEHGQNNEIASNRFVDDSVAINLWANAIEPSDWGYPKHRDTRSRDYRITSNMFAGQRVGFRLANTRAALVKDNVLINVDSVFVLRDSVDVERSANDTTALQTARDWTRWQPTIIRGVKLPARLPGGFDPRRDPLAGRDRSAIIVDEWGPYDWRSPKLWPADSSHSSPLALRVLGPAGRWRVIDRRGIASVSKESGATNDTILVTPEAGSERAWQLTLEYVGGATVSPRGEKKPAGVPYRFGYTRFEPIAEWHVAFFAWADETDPRTHGDAFAALLRGTPALTRTEARLDYMWFRPTIANLPQQKFAAVATSTVTLAPGEYTLRTIADDAIRVWVDDTLVIADWKPHDSVVSNAPITAGTHNLRVEYYQVDGWVELRVEVVRGAQRSTGSPGPH